MDIRRVPLPAAVGLGLRALADWRAGFGARQSGQRSLSPPAASQGALPDMEARIASASPTDLDALANGLVGQLLRAGDPAYEAARRGHNLAHDRHPVAIVRAADASDVALAVDAARSMGLEIAIRGGGHSIAGHSSGDGVLVVDLTTMKGLHIDPDTRLVYAQAGLLAGEVTNALSGHGLAIPFGDTASVGIAGLTLGAGIGYLARRHGLAIDHLEGVEIVTADGRIVSANAREHADLFWAVRGGGGNFGIVTRFIYRAVPVGMTYSGAIVLPATVDTIVGVARAAEAAPEGLTTITDMMVAPPMPFLPPEWVGKLILYVTAVYAGDPADGPAVMAPFRALGPIADLMAPMPYAGIYQFTAQAEAPAAYEIRSSFLAELDESTAGLAIASVLESPRPMAMFHFRILGGQMARIPADATAFAHRDARFMVMIMAGFEDPAARPDAAAWASGLLAALRPQARGVYSNFLGDEGDARVHEAYPPATYARLAAVKATWDPTNVFRRNQNIRPAS